MRFLFKALFYIVILAVVAVGGAALAFLHWPSASLKQMIAESVEEQTGRRLTIEGELERSLFPVLRVAASGVSLENADWAESGPLLTADRAEIGLRTLPLLFGAVEVEKIAIARPEIQLEIAEDGRRSWDLKGVDIDSGAGADLEDAASVDSGWTSGGGRSADEVDVLVESFEVTDGRLTILDRSTGAAPVEVSDIALNASFASLEDDLLMTGSAVAQGRPAKLDVKLASPAALARGETANLTALFEADGVAADLRGDLRAPHDGGAPQAKGSLTLALDGDKQRTAWVRALLPAELEPLEAVSIKGVFDASEAGLDIAFDGGFGFRGEASTMRGSAKAGAGWASGDQPVDLDLSLNNRLIDAGFKGAVRQTGGAAPTVNGDYRLKVADAQRLIAWSGAPSPAPGSPNALLQSLDLAGGVESSAEGFAAALAGVVGYNGRSIDLQAGARGGAGWDQGGELETNLSLAAPSLFSASWNGSISGADQAVKGDARFSSTALRAFFAWIGLGPIDAPQGAFERLDFSGALDASAEKGALEGMTLVLDDSAVRGALSYDLTNGRPAVTARLEADPIDIRPFVQAASRGDGAQSGSSGRGESAGSAQGPGGGWSKDPIDLGALHLVDADIDVRSAGLTTPVLRIGQSHVAAKLADGKLDLAVREMALYGGQATGQATIDGSGATPAMAVALDLGGVALRPLLNDSAQMDWLEGVGAAKTDIRGAGVSMDALMRSLAGSASIDFRDGAIIGYNLAAIVRNVTSLGTASGPQKTDFAELRASFQIDKGVARNSDFYMAGPLVRLEGEGLIDIGNQTLDYNATPRAVATLRGQGGGSGAGIAFPVRIHGPWADPSIEPDLAKGALATVESILVDPDGAASFLKQLDKDGIGGVLDALTGGGETGDTGGGGGRGGLGDVLKGLGGGDDDNPLRGLFGN